MSETRRIVLTVTGSDRPGLTSQISEAVHEAGGNWKEGHLSRLGGLYVGSVLIEVPRGRTAQLEAQVKAIDPVGLQVSLAPAGEAPEGHRAVLLFELVGQDRPGIVRQVSGILARLGANIESLSSSEETAAWGGEQLFRAKLRVSLPDDVSPEQVQRELEEISGEIMVDFTFAPPS